MHRLSLITLSMTFFLIAACHDQETIKPIDPAAVPDLVEQCQSPYFNDRQEAIKKLATLAESNGKLLEDALVPLTEYQSWQAKSSALSLLGRIKTLSTDTKDRLTESLLDAIKQTDADLSFCILEALKNQDAKWMNGTFQEVTKQLLKSGERSQRILIYRLCTELTPEAAFLEDHLVENLQRRIKDNTQFEESHEILSALSFVGTKKSLDRLNDFKRLKLQQSLAFQMDKTLRSLNGKS